MQEPHGFSLTEVLVSLLLVTTISLALLQQQEHARQVFHRILQSTNALLLSDNISEQSIVK